MSEMKTDNVVDGLSVDEIGERGFYRTCPYFHPFIHLSISHFTLYLPIYEGRSLSLSRVAWLHGFLGYLDRDLRSIPGFV